MYKTKEEVLEGIKKVYSIDLIGSKYLGFSESDILKSEEKLGRTFPKSYREFLLSFGKIYKIFLADEIVHLDFIPGHQESIKEEIEDQEISGDMREIEKLDYDNIFVFSCHEGWQYWYLDLSNDALDPGVYLWIDDGTSTNLHQTFSEFAIAEIGYRMGSAGYVEVGLLKISQSR